MPGPAALTTSPPAGRSSTQAWPSHVVVTGFGAALEGELPVPPALADLVTRLPVAGMDRSIVDRSPAAAALIAAIARAIAHPRAGRLPPPEERAIVVGTGAAALNEVICFLNETLEVGPNLVNPGLFPFTVINAAAGIAAIEHCFRGPNLTLSNGGTSALEAIAYAADLVASGQATVALAGGFEGLSARVGEALARTGPPVSIAAVWMVTTREHAAAMGGLPAARILAFGAGEWPELEPAAAAAEMARTVVAAASALAGGAGAAPLLAAASPELGLLALIGAVERLASGELSAEQSGARSEDQPAHLLPVVAAGESRGSAAALALAPAGSGRP